MVKTANKQSSARSHSRTNPKQKDRPEKHTVQPSNTIKPSSAALVSSPSKKQLQLHFKTYIDQVVKKSRIFTVISGGKEIAVLGPVSSLPATMSAKINITENDILENRFRISSVSRSGPYMIMRRAKEVAVLYSPQPAEASKLQKLFNDLEKFEIMSLAYRRREEQLQAEIARLSEIRRKAEAMATGRIEFLRRILEGTEADRLQDELRALVYRDKDI